MTNIDKDRTALLVIDVLEGGGADAIYSEGEKTFNESCAAVTKGCRAAGIPVILSCDQHIPGLDRELDLWGDHGIKGSAAAEPAWFLERAESDFHIPKRRYSGFFQTDLDLTLRELGVDTLIAIGCDTNICVLHTLADAYYRGYKTIVVEDATRTFLCGTQEAGIEHFEKCYGSEIISSGDLLEMLA